MARYSKFVDYWEQQEEFAQSNNFPMPDRSNPTKEQLVDLEELGCTVYIVLWDRIFGGKHDSFNIYAFANILGF